MKRLILALALMAGPAHAQWIDGNLLHKWCSSGDASEYASCAAFILGTIDANTDAIQWIDIFQADEAGAMSVMIAPYCMPDGVNGAQVKDVVTKYLTENPADRHLSGVSQVRAALENAFPCQ